VLAVAVGAVCLSASGGNSTSGKSGELTDPRDGKIYKTTKIRNQTWMVENLNYATSRGSWCYGNSADSCAKYGRLYAYDAAKTACPVGWHLPSRAEWGDLVKEVGSSKGSKKLKSTIGWYKNGNGTDDYGFSALPGGFRSSMNGGFGGAGRIGLWWTATEGGSGYFDRITYSRYYCRRMAYDDDYVLEGVAADGLSVRCVQD